MKIIDTNGLDFAVKSGVAIDTTLLITPDIQEEFEAGHGGRLPKNVRNAYTNGFCDRSFYIQSYKAMLNTYGGRSFYNMGGFGDISILALLGAFRLKSLGTLPGLEDEMLIITDDKGLRRRIKREFQARKDSFGKAVTLKTPIEFFLS